MAVKKTTLNIRRIERSELWEQDADTCDDRSINGDPQVINVRILDGGGGPYLIFDTERWALNEEDIDAFAAELKALFKGINSTYG